MAQLPPPSRAGLLLAIAAIAVNAPRLILAFLEADGIAVPLRWRAALLGITGVATGVVLTGGGAYLAHAVAHGARRRRTLAAAWLLVLTCSAVLVTPMLVAGLARAELARILPTARGRWIWSATAVLAVELVAAGAMVAYGARQAEWWEAERADRELIEVAGERDRLRRQLTRLSGRLEAAEAAARSPSHPCRYGCGALFNSPPAERGHLRTCPNRPQETPTGPPASLGS